MLPTTDEYLITRVDPYIAVERALNAAERHAFLAYRLVGPYEGAKPADWLAEADNADAFLEHIESWWREHGDKAVAYLMTLSELPQPLVKQLLTAALYATLGIASADLGERRRTHIEIAMGAALYARGIADALGWCPPESI